MAFGSQRLRAIRIPLLLFVVSLMTAVATAAPVLENLHLGQRVDHFLHPYQTAFQGRGRLSVWASTGNRFQRAGYVGWDGTWVDGSDSKAVAVFDSRRVADGQMAVLRTTRNAQCAADIGPSRPVLTCSTSLGPESHMIGPIDGNRIELVWATLTPREAAAMPGPPRQKAFISVVLPKTPSHEITLKWEPVYG
ncbi:MAG: hypothetical protein M1826_006672 [Phylliscum demangeonii]|nr:MAG: hypothetical protein M1826_006672 [Phylliscum demangeonii]